MLFIQLKRWFRAERRKQRLHRNLAREEVGSEVRAERRCLEITQMGAIEGFRHFVLGFQFFDRLLTSPARQKKMTRHLKKLNSIFLKKIYNLMTTGDVGK